jgi:hypothetical protein
MATALEKFDNFVKELCEANIDCNGDTFKMYLSNEDLVPATDTYWDGQTGTNGPAEITNENGYTAPVDITNTGSESGGTYTVDGAVTTSVIASGGTVGPFRYVHIYDDTPTTPVADPLVCGYDYGSAITLQDGEQFDFNITTTLFTVA